MDFLREYVIDNDIYLLPDRIAYIRSLDALVVADLHLGIEYALALKGVYLPAYQFKEIIGILDSYLDRYKPAKLIIVGDLKHEFGQKTWQEHRETLELLESMRRRGINLVLVRGNHDNFIRGVLERNNVDFRDPVYIENEYLFIHGHKELPTSIDLSSIKYIVMGHEHPAIMFRDEVGSKDKFPTFLFGDLDVSKKLIVLPALSPVATGVEVNVADSSDFLSPILRKIDIGSFYAVPSLRSGLLRPIKIENLRLFS